MGAGAWLALVVAGAAPSFETTGDLEPQATLQREARAAWSAAAGLVRDATGRDPDGSWVPVRIERGALSSGLGGESRLGVIRLRQTEAWRWTEAELSSLRHEVAHQFLWMTCPASSEDRLFHEAFAMLVSGEGETWRQGPYLSLTRAREVLDRSASLDRAEARRAIARLLIEGGAGPLPPSVARRLRLCAADARWEQPFSAAEMAQAIGDSRSETMVVLNRHTGEALVQAGEPDRPIPFGSTLKPFVVAGASDPPPRLWPRRASPEWSCGAQLPSPVDARTALIRSCNGYFLDWSAAHSAVSGFGAWGPLLEALGLERPPTDAAEAIGLKSSLTLSPRAVAQAYRALAEAKPELIGWLRATASEGTLSELPTSVELSGAALKTGTVRDGDSRPRYGWIVTVTDDLVMVMVRSGRMPRSFASELVTALGSARQLVGQSPAAVQVFGLLPPGEVEASCAQGGVALREGAPTLLGSAHFRLSAALEGGAAVCLGGPFRVRFPGGPARGREYAGVFRFDPPPPWRPTPGARPPSERERRARTGSSFLFRTSLALYTAGVLRAEDEQIKGEARIALARVVAHNAARGRHPGRPICDTTHCQAFKGTTPLQPGDEQALRQPALPTDDWLHFSQGGDEPWRHERSAREVEGALGIEHGRLQSLEFRSGRMFMTLTTSGGEATWDETNDLPCDPVRSALRLPACPVTARLRPEQVVFEGRGRGHGVGLDLERAKRTPGSGEALLEQTYGFQLQKR